MKKIENAPDYLISIQGNIIDFRDTSAITSIESEELGFAFENEYSFTIILKNGKTIRIESESYEHLSEQQEQLVKTWSKFTK